MFEGTVRDNLDPRHVHDDTELWSVLGTLARRINANLLLTVCRARTAQGPCIPNGGSAGCARSRRRYVATVVLASRLY